MGAHRCELLAKERAVELPVRRPRYLVAHVHRRRAPCRAAVRACNAPMQRPRPSSSPPAARHHERDLLAQRRVVHAECDRVADEPGRVRGLFDLGRADAVARRLDHLVRAARRSRETPPRRRTTVSPDHTAISGAAPRRVVARGGPEALGGALRVVPVAERDERAAVDELALLARGRTACRPGGRRGSPRSGSPCRSSRAACRPRTGRDTSTGTPPSGRTSGTAVPSGTARGACRASSSACGRPCWRSTGASRRPPRATSARRSGSRAAARTSGPVTPCRSQSRTTSRGHEVVHEDDVRADVERRSSAG